MVSPLVPLGPGFTISVPVETALLVLYGWFSVMYVCVGRCDSEKGGMSKEIYTCMTHTTHMIHLIQYISKSAVASPLYKTAEIIFNILICS